MFLKAKSTAPRPDYSAFDLPVLGGILDYPLTIFMAPSGYLLTDSLASVLSTRECPICWVRLGLEDCDPATLLLSLVSAGQQISPDIGIATFNQMRMHPGPIAGWGQHFTHLASELSEMLPEDSVLILENIESINYSSTALNSLWSYFLPRLGKHIHCILISRDRIPRATLPTYTHLIDSHDLRLDENAGMRMIQHTEANLTANCINRFIGLTAGRVTALVGLVQASLLLGPTLVDQEVRRAVNMDDCLSRIAGDNLAGSNENTLQTLALAMHFEYCHPAMLAAVQPEGPWFQPLTDGWEYMRDLWVRPLRKTLRARANPDSDVVHQAAEFLSGQGAYFPAINLYFESRDMISAARSITVLANSMMDLGQWATLNAWLKRLPPAELVEWPWLVYMSGKIAAAQGHAESARKAFSSAGILFNRRQESMGTCLSLLAESALAAWRSDITFSKERALTAYTLAQRKNLNWYQSWAAWQLGSLAANAGDLDEALQWFSPAAAQAGNNALAEMLHLAEKLIQRRQALHQQREIQQQEFLETDRAVRAVSARLQNLLSSPPENLDMLLETHGWTHTPLMPISSAIIQPMPGENGNPFSFNLFHLLANVLNLQPTIAISGKMNPPTADDWYTNLPGPGLGSNSLEHKVAARATDEQPAEIITAIMQEGLPDISLPSVDELPVPVPIHPPVHPHQNPAPHSKEKGSSTQEKLSDQPEPPFWLRVRLLGQFDVELNNEPLAEWSNNRARATFKYLLIHRDQLTPREVLMETFWPNTTPESARNNLNVALHNLRVALQSTPTHPIVLFQNGAYRLDPGLAVWVDLDEFNAHVRQGHHLEESGNTDGALKEYEAAVELYKGDFLSDDPYEEWPVLIRERLRVTYLETLDRLSQIYFARDEYNSCIALCQLILSNDACREDAHSRLMRCYSRLGQDHLALRQYQVCLDTLRAELDVSPAPATTLLCEKARRHEVI